MRGLRSANYKGKMMKVIDNLERAIQQSEALGASSKGFGGQIGPQTFSGLSWEGEWNYQMAMSDGKVVVYKDYDEGKAEGDRLVFVRTGEDWRCITANTAFGFPDIGGKEIDEGVVLNSDELVKLIKEEVKNRSELRTADYDKSLPGGGIKRLLPSEMKIEAENGGFKIIRV